MIWTITTPSAPVRVASASLAAMTQHEPEIQKNGTPACPTTALASSVLPVPGGPTGRTPLGMRAPSRPYLSLSLRNETISSKLGFGLIHASDIIEYYAGVSLDQNAGLGLADVDEPADALPLGEAAENEVPDADEDRTGMIQDKRVERKVF